MKDRYKLNLHVKTLEPALRYKAIANENAQIIDAYSTDSELQEYHLKHSKMINSSSHLTRSTSSTGRNAQKYPQLEEVLNQLAGKITEKDMQDMNYQVNVEGKSPGKVARTYLTEHQFISN
ncbi:hypothetical protein MU448_00875 [Streptococcus sp. O1]|uniref:glycine betaine ABC transporter substrate-binding protein n=1 Tax=Streptococcus sp. O1 TaxID=2928735 RepID=UPI00211B1952|nr:glycine betaine ABC transporter substrate-binding protein [Streptococcus sp. O1]MCQ9213020.1 hypothetical protein [Streptococcus sp. O1]